MAKFATDRLRTIMLAVCMAASPAVAQAANVTVSGEDPRSSITVTIEDATIDFVIEKLRDTYGFDVSGLSTETRGDPQTMTVSGTLRSVLERLLRNWNHVIVASQDNKTGIAKVMIVNSNYGASPATAAKSDDADNKVTQALHGEGVD
jgi:hypothetical protein